MYGGNYTLTMKTIILSLLLSVIGLNAQPHIVGISQVFCEPFFGCYVYVFAEQLANKSVTIEGATSANFHESYVAAFYDCYTERQTVVATFPANTDYTFYRARNDPCNGNLVPRIQMLSKEYIIVNGMKLHEIISDEPNFSAKRRYVAFPLI